MSHTEIAARSGKAYICEKQLEELAEVDALIFDCDGVLIDVRKSYDAAINRTVAYIMGKLVPKDFSGAASQRLIYRLRKSGGFNNDWDTVYVILLGTFAQLDDEFLTDFLQVHQQLAGKRIQGAGERFTAYVAQLRRLRNLKEGTEIYEPFPSSEGRRRLLALADYADSSGVQSVERQILSDGDVPARTREAIEAFRQFLDYPSALGQSIVTTVFDEIFYGADHCRTVYGQEPKFNTGAGCVENEKPILTEPTMRKLVKLFGQKNLGIVSGRALKSAQQTLGQLLDYFNPEALIFLEDEMRKVGLDNSAKIGKPEPYGLLKAAAAVGAFKRAIYVGDSAEDFIMVQRAKEVDDRFLFAGVYRFGHAAQEKREWFKRRGASLIVPSVNDLPGIVSQLRRRESDNGYRSPPHKARGT